MANAPAQNRAPGAETKVRNRQNVYYPQARAVFSVVLENYGTPKEPLVFPVIPRSCTIHANSYKEADTWSLEFDAHNLPFSTDLFRNGQVEIYLYQTQGIGQQPQILRPSDEDDDLDGITPSIVGLFDESQIEISNDGGTYSIDGMDFTSLLIAKQWDPRVLCPTGKTLDKVVRDLVGGIPGVSGVLSVVTDPVDLQMPVIGAAETRTNKNGISFSEKENFWDVIYSICIRYGFIVFVRNLEVVITTPQAYVAGKTRVHSMLYGRNLSHIRMSRRMGKETVPVVEVRSYDDAKRQPISARYPKNAKQQVTGVGTKKDEIRVMTIPGIRSIAQLERVAETYYNLVSRSESKVEIQTMDLLDLDGQDLLAVRAGDAMSVGFDSFNSETLLIEAQSMEQRINTLKQLGYKHEVAAKIAAAFEQVSLFKHPYRVKEVTFEWSIDSGLSISAELHSFVDISGKVE